MGKYKAIEECRDGHILINALNDDILADLEIQLERYLSSSGEPKSTPPIVEWWEELLDTSDILEEYKERLS